VFVDASALIAVLLLEPEQAEINRKMVTADRVLVSALSVWETSRALARVREQPLSAARSRVWRYLQLTNAALVPIGSKEEEAAHFAVERFGKGRHPAKLNMGDCFSYACARVHGVPLLYKGDDFALTDIERA